MVGNVLTPAHLLILLAIALIVLGPKRLPAAGRGLGEAMRDFKDALTSGDRSDTAGPQLSEGRRIMQASDAAGAGTTSQATTDRTSLSYNEAPRSEPTAEAADSNSSSTEGSSNPLQHRS
jgi:sec-independent protein translocase protein TatA